MRRTIPNFCAAAVLGFLITKGLPLSIADDPPIAQPQIPQDLEELIKKVSEIEEALEKGRPAIAEKPRKVPAPVQRRGLLPPKIQIALPAQPNPFQVQPRHFGPPSEPSHLGEKSPFGDSSHNTNAKSEESVEDLKKRAHQIQTDLARLKNTPAPKAPNEDQLIVVLDTPHFTQGNHRSPNTYLRAFAVRMRFANPTKQEIVLKGTDITLTAQGKTYKTISNGSSYSYYSSFRVGSESFSISSLRFPTTLKVPAGKTANAWAVFQDIPMNPAIPELQLLLDVGKEKRKIDLNEYFETMLKAKTERLGPHQCLGMVTIAGQLNPVNLGNLMTELDTLAVKEKVARVVIRWEKDADPVDSNLMGWLMNSATASGLPKNPNQNNNANTFPLVPMSIQELHLAELPKANATTFSNKSKIKVHKTTGEATTAALRSAYRALSTNEIVDDLNHENPYIRAAALAGGGGQLPPDKLPLLLKFVKGDDLDLQRAAIYALRNFGEKEAIATLIDLVKKNQKPSAQQACTSLATSRFDAAPTALLNLLKTATPDIKTNIMTVLSQHPRPLWSDQLAEVAKHPETPLGMPCLRALVKLGHPDLFPILKNALAQQNESIQIEVFDILAQRNEPASQHLALEYMVQHLKTKPLSGQMSTLIYRTKDPRVIPLLVKQFKSNKNNRYSLITTLSQIGDQSVVDLLVSTYPKMNENEQREVLQGLERLQAPEFMKLATQALNAKNSSLISQAAEGLSRDGSDQAEKALIDSLELDVKHSYWRYICNALVNFGSPKAKEALYEARKSNDANKKSAAISAMRNLQQRSAGSQFIYQAKSYFRQLKLKEALQYYDLSVRADPEYADGYIGRANVYLHQNKIKEAKADYEQAVKADPDNTSGHAGLAIMMILEGKIEEGVKLAESTRKELGQYQNNQAEVLYDSASVYGRAVEKLKAAPAGKDRDQKIKTYQTKAVAELSDVIKKYHFSEFDRLKADPNFKSLAKLPEFQKLLPGNKKPKKAAPKNNGGQEAEAAPLP